MRVVKFGGSSVATPILIHDIAKYLKSIVVNGEKLVVVVSAMGDETDVLVNLASQIVNKPCGRELDQLLATGEIRSISLLALALNTIGVNAISLSAQQVGLFAEGDYQNAKVQNINVQCINEKLEEYDILVVAGFQGINSNDEVVTLGRGGSDTTAVALACALGVECEVYTDVYGVYSTDPRRCKNAKKLDNISFDEMIELSTLGAKVMHNRSIMLAKKYNTNVYVAKSLSDVKGTLIMNKESIGTIKESNNITAVTVQDEVLRTTVDYDNKVNIKIEKQILSMLNENKINHDMISQVNIENNNYFTFVTPMEQKDLVCDLMSRFGLLEIKVKHDIYSRISIVGCGLKESGGMISEILDLFDKNSINFYQISTSDLSVSFLISFDDLDSALNKIMEKFNLVD